MVILKIQIYAKVGDILQISKGGKGKT